VDPCGFTMSVPMGKGLFVWKREKRFFEAWCSFNGKLNGRGRQINEEPLSLFEGEFINDLMHGKGFIKNYVEKSEYSGDTRRGKRDGYGIYKYPNGDMYQGEWLENQPHGKGKYTWAHENRTTEGMWRHGRKHGEHMF
jgi:hypothetical protein